MKLKIPDNIMSLKPYKPGKPIEELEREYGISDSIKLASNENPLGPSPKAIPIRLRDWTDLPFQPAPVVSHAIRSSAPLSILSPGIIIG